MNRFYAKAPGYQVCCLKPGGFVIYEAVLFLAQHYGAAGGNVDL